MKIVIRVILFLPALVGILWAADQAPTTKKIPIPQLMKPTGIFVDDSRLYIVETSSISIFNKKDLMLIKKFGKAGEGPEEFKANKAAPIKLIPLTNTLAITSMGRISYFKKNGTYIRERRHNRSGNIYALGENLLISDWKVRGETVAYYVSNDKLEKIAELDSFMFPFSFKKKIYRMIPPNSFPVFSDGYVFLTHGTGIEINGFNSMGKQVVSVKYTDEKIKVPEELKEVARKRIKNDLSQKMFYNWLRFPEYFPGIKDFKVSDKHIFVRTFRKREANEAEFLIFDFKGK
ncbi:MAG: hypothetical protein GY765_28160, partial [bacterium]|nr:hypothetical protein [bacterium]